MKKFTEIVKNQFEDPDSIILDMDTKFRELDSFDSLTGMCIIVAIKDEFGVEITEEEFRTAITVADLLNLTKK